MLNISTNTRPLVIKRDKVVTYNEEFPPIKS